MKPLKIPFVGALAATKVRFRTKFLDGGAAVADRTDAIFEKVRDIYESSDDRTGQYVDTQKDYDKSWQSRVDKLFSYIKAGERNIPDLFARYRNYWMGGRWKPNEMARFVAHGAPVDLLAVPGYVYYRTAVAHSIVSAAREDTVAVIELGSGLGESLFTVWGEGKLRSQRYVACEISQAGRKASRMIAALDPRLKFEARHFDYRKPDFSGLRFEKGHVVVLSTHSIEQVDVVPDDLIDRIIEIAPSVTCLNFEPIGWQFDPNHDSPVVEAHKARCLEMGYNQNYWDLLQRKSAAGKIKITEAVPYFFGFEYNPPCKIVWQSDR